MKNLVLCLLLSLTLSAAAATSKTVSYKSGDETVQGVLYTPSGQSMFPAIIVIHEWWGLNDWVKDQATKLSDQGYVTLAIDLYRGKVATTPEEAHELMRGVPEDRAKRDLHAAFEFLASQTNVQKARIASIGWCMGGGYSLDVALQEPTLRAVVINYGHLATDTDSLKAINASVLRHLRRSGPRDSGGRCSEVREDFEAVGKAGGRDGLSRCGTRLRKPRQQGWVSRRRRGGRLEADG